MWPNQHAQRRNPSPRRKGEKTRSNGGYQQCSQREVTTETAKKSKSTERNNSPEAESACSKEQRRNTWLVYQCNRPRWQQERSAPNVRVMHIVKVVCNHQENRAKNKNNHSREMSSWQKSWIRAKNSLHGGNVTRRNNHVDVVTTECWYQSEK